MPNRLYSDLLDATNRRYYFDLDSAPGGVTPAPATLTIFGRSVTIQELSTVFRTPATAALSLIGLSLGSPVVLIPATAALAVANSVVGLQKLQTITNALPPDYTALPDNPPTLITIMTVSPNKATLTISYPTLNLTQGGNIVSVTPGVGLLTLAGLGPNTPVILNSAGLLSLSGLLPSIRTELIVAPDVGLFTMGDLAPEISVPFLWVDDPPAPTVTWID